MLTRVSRYAVAVACLLSLLLAACGGRSGSGSAGPGGWQYTAMGDSLAVGAIAAEGYVPRYQSDLQTDANPNGVSATNLGVNGAHSGDLLNSIQTNQSFRGAISNAQVVTWDIGGDDLLHAVGLFQNGTCGGADNQQCLRDAVSSFGPNWDAIVAQILQLRDPKTTIIRTMNVYNPFVAQLMLQGQFNTIEPYLDQVNAKIASSAAANGIPMADIHAVFNGPNGDQDPISKGLIAIDGVHPNDSGHKAIADALRALAYAPLK